jgi:transcriptional regulator GlxA family with amidase domain
MTVHSRLCRARDLLAETPASVDQAAREAGMSPFHFIRQFERMFGATPRQYRTAARLERAKTLLAAGDLSVTDVCLEVGFTSLGSFSDLFARRVGSSPSEYRRRTLVTVPELRFPGCLTLMEAAFRNFGEAFRRATR